MKPLDPEYLLTYLGCVQLTITVNTSGFSFYFLVSNNGIIYQDRKKGIKQGDQMKKLVQKILNLKPTKKVEKQGYQTKR